MDLNTVHLFITYIIILYTDLITYGNNANNNNKRYFSKKLRNIL